MNVSLEKITGGDLDEKVNVRTNMEFASLSDDINENKGMDFVKFCRLAADKTVAVMKDFFAADNA